MPETQERIAYFGGTFDPPHVGHRAIAVASAERFGLDRVLFAPAGRQPLKSAAAAAGFADRLAMVELLCADLQDESGTSKFEASVLDAPRTDGAANFTIDALRALREKHPSSALFAVVGADAFADLGRWREPEALLEEAEWIVVSRPDGPGVGAKEMVLTTAQEARVHRLDGVEVPVNATEIRARLAAGKDCSAMLSAGVLQYIREHRLYGAGAGA